MGFDDFFRLSAHAVITDDADRVLLLRAVYADRGWGLPGGALDPGETVHEALLRECREELGCDVRVEYLSGIYCHTQVRSHAFVFRCSLPQAARIVLSDEHSEYAYTPVHELAPVQRRRVEDCLAFRGVVRSARF